MRLLKTSLLLIIASTFCLAQKFETPAPFPTDGAPPFIVGKGESIFLKGDFGNLNGRNAAANTLRSFSPLLGDAELVEVSDKTDHLGMRHVRVHQYIDGKPVIGSEMIVHADKSGAIYAINGRFIDTNGAQRRATISEKGALAKGLAMANLRDAKLLEPGAMAYVADDNGRAFLAWSFLVSYEDSVGPQKDRLYVDANGSNTYVRHPLHQHSRNRRTYTANNGTSLPGSLVRTEGSGNSGDAALDAAHNNAGTTYDFYNSVFGRDSYDNNGATMYSTVHYSSNYNNAFWNGSQMVYGDGDGSTFSPLSQSLDVVAHELTHAVTSSESNLVYSYESGALNEAMSDIFGAACESWSNSWVINSNTWSLGEDIYTPGTPGDALRYMDDPAAAGDRDYYPTRYTGSADNGGVHTNSGIANLAFVLLVEGGTHPRGKTTVNVSSIGIQKAIQIFYRANTVYLTSSSNFQAARNATASAAADLYGQTEVDAVHEAWDAVGVPGSGGGGGGGGSCSGVTETGSLSGTGAESFHPNGTYYYSSTSGTHTASLNGPSSADFDLYLWKWSGSWGTVASSTSASSVESITYNGTSGYYAWRVYSYSGSGSYTICTDKP